MIKSIKLVGIPVENQQRALDFYVKILGFEKLQDVPFNEKQRWIELGLPGRETRISLFTPDGQEDRVGTFQNFSFDTDDIDSLYQHLINVGVKCDGSPSNEEWGRALIFKDSEGNTLCVCQERN